MKKVLAWSSVAALILFATLFFYLLVLAKDLPSLEQIDFRQISQSTKIYDRSGKVRLYEISSGQKRTLVPLSEMPQALKDATIVTEDENFYNEPAFNWLAIGRAILVNLWHGHILQGGSTITQQLARSAFLSPEQTITRKLKEFLLAIQLNRRYSKDQILEFYLNQVPYGPNLYGVEVASEAYFNKPAKDLSIAESGLLAALPRAPSYYSPWGRHLNELLARQQYILKRMEQAGKISQAQYLEASKTKLSFSPQNPRGLLAPHFVMEVQDYLIQKYGEEMVRRGGLKVITTLDWDLQQLAEKVVSEGGQKNEELYRGKNAALVAQDARTGQILALVGSRNYFNTKNDGNFDVATMGSRQPGSALKPFAYLTAFEKGYTPDTVVFDAPTEFVSNNPGCPANVDFSNNNPDCFHPKNFDEKFRGPVSLRQALAQSINVPSVKVLYLANLNDVLQTLHNFGITTLSDPSRYGLSLVLGGGEVKLINLVEAYAVLSQDGLRHQQTMVLEVKDGQGNILESYQDKPQQLVDAQYPRLVNDVLSDSEARAGLFGASLNLTVFPGYDVALKTGTTNDYRDAWAMGYTPSLVVGVWAGNNDNAPMQKHAGSILAAVPIWNEFMAQALKTQPALTFSRPAPTAAAKPILAGDYLANKQVHSILYYIDRADPLGPAPTNPSNDLEFNNWEFGVLEWAKSNLADFSNYNQPIVSAGPTIGLPISRPDIKIIQPGVGSFVSDKINVLAQLSAGAPLTEIRVYLNNNLVRGFSGNFGQNYEFDWSFNAALQPQNLLSIEVEDQAQQSARADVIFYAP